MFGWIGYYVWRRQRGYKRSNGRAAGVARVLAYMTGVGVVVAGLSFRSAMADVGEASQSIGRELLPLADVLGQTSRVHLNGETISIGNAITSESLDEVLDRFEQNCHEHRAASGDAWAGLGKMRDRFATIPEKSFKALPDQDKLKATLGRIMGLPVDSFGTYRTRGGEQGVVMCFVQTDGTPTDAKIAWKELKETGDLGKLGAVRYVYASRTKDGNTHVMTAWTDGSFNMNSIIVKDGDAPGDDSAFLGRPPRSRRVVVGSVDGTPYGVRIYESAASQAEVLDYYDQKMDADGWIKIKPPGEERAKQRAYMKDGVQIAVVTEKGQNGTSVVLGELGREAQPERL
jgi:hypothetical protein